VVGLILFSLRRYLIIDNKQNIIGRYFGVLGVGFIPIKRWNTSSARAVRLSTKWEKDGDGDSYEVFVLRISGIKDELFAERVGYKDTRRIGIEIARLLGVPFSDAMSGRVSTLRPEHFDLSLAARARLSDAAVERPDPPITSLASFREDAGRTVVTLHATRSGARIAFIASGIAALFAVSLMVFIPDIATGVVMGIFMLVVGAGFLRAGWMALEPIEVTIASDHLTIRCTPVFRRHVRFDLVQECVLGEANLYLIGANQVIMIPYEFRRGEAREIGKYLHDKIWHSARGCTHVNSGCVAAS